MCDEPACDVSQRMAFTIGEEGFKIKEIKFTIVSSIISNQKKEHSYDYMTNEQIEIDRLVYEMYNLNDEDIQEVESWYFRHYPKLARVIEEKLKKKRTTDYTD